MSVSTTFTIDAAERANRSLVGVGDSTSGVNLPVTSSAGKPLTTAAITFTSAVDAP